MYVNTSRFSQNFFEKTYSWRTGSDATPAYSEPPFRRSGESLGSYLNRRNAFYASAAESMLSSTPYQGHVLTSDAGHEFFNIKIISSPGRFTNMYRGSVVRENLCVPELPVSDQLYLKLSVQDTSNASYGGKLSALDASADANLANLRRSQLVGAYNNMIPDKQLFGWGETIIELMRGNIPRIPELFRRAQRGAKLNPKATGRALGGDYLSARFGIEPIVKDFISTVEHMMSVHDMIYDTFKRERRTEMISGTSSSRRTVVTNHQNTPNYWGGITMPLKAAYTPSFTDDTRIKAKFTKASPTRRADDFYKQAQEFLYSIGFTEKLTWDLLPWSWLIDWSGNIGSSIENAAAFNPNNGRHLASYAWATRVMTFQSHHPAAHWRDPWDYNNESFVTPGYTTAVLKHRTKVSPFGPTFTMPSLSAYQMSILASLGLARLK